MEKRYIGIDLHRNRFTCCIRLGNERTYVTEWALEDSTRFVKKLRPNDEVAVEITSNTRLFCDAVEAQVARGGRQQSVPRDQLVGEENGCQRCAAAVSVSVQGIAAGGAHEG